MNERPLPAARAAARRSWRMILATALMAGAAWLATSAALRALAQDATPPAASPVPAEATEPPAGAGADGTVESNEAEEVTRRAPPPKPADEEAPEFRESADNNLSFPIDI